MLDTTKIIEHLQTLTREEAAYRLGELRKDQIGEVFVELGGAKKGKKLIKGLLVKKCLTLLESQQSTPVTPKKKAAKKAVKKTGEDSLRRHSPTALLRWMGNKGYVVRDAKVVLRAYGVTLAESTISSSVSDGKHEYPGLKIPELTEDEAAQVAQIVQEGYK